MFWEVYIYIDIYSLSGCFNPKRLTNEKDTSKSWRIYCSTQALIETFGSFDTPYSSWCCLFRYSEETDVYTLRSRDILIVDFVQLTVYYATPVPELIEGVHNNTYAVISGTYLFIYICKYFATYIDFLPTSTLWAILCRFMIYNPS